MIFQPRQKRQKLNINLEINNCNIERVKETTFLGTILDETLSWKLHITNVSRKIAKFVGILHKTRFCLPTSSLCTLYYSLVYTVSLYLVNCVSVWGPTDSSNLLDSILKLQKKVISQNSCKKYILCTILILMNHFLSN